MLVGSYSLSLAARCYNWESLFALETRQDDVFRFDALWDNLEGRTIMVFDPDEQLFPEKERTQIRQYKGEMNQKQSALVVNPYKKRKPSS